MGNEKYTGIVAYTTPSGRLHLGHGLGHTLADVTIRYESQKSGKEGYFPIGIHSTGKDLVKILDKFSGKGDKEGVYKRYNISEEEAQEILSYDTLDERVDRLVSIYRDQYSEAFEKLGVQIDMSSFFSSHQEANHRYTQWTLKKLNEQGLITETQSSRYYCPQCDEIKAIESDFSEVEPMGAVDLDNLNITEGAYFLFGGNSITVPVYTTRPETIFGVTNLYFNQDMDYVEILRKGENSSLLVEEESLDQLIEMLGDQHKIKNVKKYQEKLEGHHFRNPLTGDEVPLLNSGFVKKNSGTGFVMAVPSHDPVDYHNLKKVAPELLASSENIIVDENNNPISFSSEEISEDNLDEIRKDTYKRQEDGYMSTNDEDFSGLTVSNARNKLLEKIIQEGKGGEFLKIDGGKFSCKTDDSRIVAKRTKERAIDYSNPELQRRTSQLIQNMKIHPSSYREELEEYIRTRKPKPFERNAERNVGADSPFDSNKKVEALSDSNIYMEFYGVSQLITQGIISEEHLTDEFFDYLFLSRGDTGELSEKLGLSEDNLMKAKEHIKSRYPIDLNVAATEHKDVHFPFSLLTHAAVLPESYFPREYLLTSLITNRGEKMSKSKGNVVYLDDLISEVQDEHLMEGFSENVSYDSIRYFLTNYQSLDRNFDWDNEVFTKEGVNFFKKFVQRKEKHIEELESTNEESSLHNSTLTNMDKWLLTTMQKNIQEISSRLDERDFRKANIQVFNQLDKSLNYYINNADERNPAVEREVLDAQLRMIYPFTPRTAEELYSRAFDSTIEGWPTIDDSEMYPEEFEEIETTLDSKRKKLQIGKVESELGKMFGRKEISTGDEVMIKVPAEHTKNIIQNSNSKKLKNIDITFQVDPTIDEIKVVKN